MKAVVKSIFYKLIMFVILCLLWCLLLQENIFNIRIINFIIFIITYIIVEIVYSILENKTKILTKRIIKYISIGIYLILFIVITLISINCDRIINGYDPVLTKKEIVVVYEEERASIIKYESFAYTLIVYNNAFISFEDIKILPFGIGNYSFVTTNVSVFEVEEKD